MRLILSVLFCLICFNISGQRKELVYFDASHLTIIGKPLPTSKPFTRLDTTICRFEDKEVIKFAEYSTGLAVVFRTDSRNIGAKWMTSGSNAGANMTAIAQKGLDLYIRIGGEWIFAGVGMPSMHKAPYENHDRMIVENMICGEKECLLYLPLFDRVDKLEIGIDDGAYIRPMANPFKHKVVFKGSSITHGASASRSGMTFPALWGRENGIEVCNMGFSGKSKLQKEYAYVLAATKADAFVFDTFSNPSAQEIYENFDAFVEIIRASHPETPLVFLQTERRETRNFNCRIEETEAAKQHAAEEVVRRRMKKDKNIYFVDSSGFLGYDHIGTVDGTHPNDIGFSRMLKCISKKILRIVK